LRDRSSSLHTEPKGPVPKGTGPFFVQRGSHRGQEGSRKYAIFAASIVVAHNHPSDDLEPSPNDLIATKITESTAIRDALVRKQRHIDPVISGVKSCSIRYCYNMKPQVNNLFEFSDFKKFLADYQSKRQETDASFTKSRLCKDLGLPKTRSFFNDIVKGTRPLSKANIERFVDMFRMDEDEAQYFRILVDFGQADRDKERELLFDQLIALNRTPKKLVDPDKYQFYRHWYHTAIFSALDVLEFSGDYKKLANWLTPAITIDKAKESIRLLKRLGLIQKNSKGVWKATDRTLDTGPMIRHELVKGYQLQSLEIAKHQLLHEHEPDGSISYSTVTVSISQPAHEQIMKRLQKFKSEVRAIAHKDSLSADRIYQLNIQYYPQSNLGLSRV
jgi:uncharacterized protein (TIGR02147 family)